jgi:hypothetical protein
MNMSTVKRSLVALAAFALLAASCGQYEHVHANAVANGEVAASSGDLSGGGTDTTGSLGGDTTGGTSTSGGDFTSGGTSTGTGTTGTDTTGGSDTGGSDTGGSDTGGSTQPPPSSAGDTTGVTANSITIGLHAPVTGAAPVPVNSFEQGVNLYWKYGDNGKPVKIFGRSVNVVFKDDHYNPSYARQVCQQMAEQDKAFLLIGGAGTDQIKACAEYSQSQGIPYLSAGVTETELNNFSTYFGISATYPAQTVLLDQYIAHSFTNDTSQIVMIAEDTPNFDDAVAVFQKDFPGAKIYRPAKNDDGSSMAPNICAGPQPLYKVVYPLVAPVYYLEMAKAASCHPQYLGVGLTNGLDTVANAGCAANNSTDGAQFFNPSPAWQDRAKFDKSYEVAIAAAQKDKSDFPDDDVVWLLWGLMKTVGSLLDQGGQNLTRGGFIEAAQNAKVHTGVYPDLQFSPSDHFGASQVHVLQNLCKSRGNTAGYYVTKYAFKTSF